jgi:hypothetical protein
VLEAGRGVVRASRAAVATLLVLGLAASAHTLGGGVAPGALALAVLALLISPLTWWATRRRLGPWRLVALLGGAQALVHAGLTAMAPHAGTAAAGHVHGGVPAGLVAEAAGATASAHPGHGLGASMLLAHALATAVTAVVLSRAEDVLWRVVAVLLPRVGRPAPAPLLVRPLRAPEPLALAGRSPRPLGGRAPPVVLA